MTGDNDPEDELDPELDPELNCAPEPELVVDAEADDPEPAVAGAFLASAGSWPVTSWMKIPAEVARKVAVASPATRRRIILTRSRRARSRCAAPVGRPSDEMGSGACGGVIGVSLRIEGKAVMTTVNGPFGSGVRVV